MKKFKIFEKIKKIAKSNIQLVGHISANELKQYMQKAKAFVFAAAEDFGIVPVEAQACGTPVIAFGKGGTLETIINGKTGLFFKEQTMHHPIVMGRKNYESIPEKYRPFKDRINIVVRRWAD